MPAVKTAPRKNPMSAFADSRLVALATPFLKCPKGHIGYFLAVNLFAGPSADTDIYRPDWWRA
jgi:hypothetical protein